MIVIIQSETLMLLADVSKA